MSKRISGNKIANKIKKDIKKKISLMEREIVFSIIYVGKDPVIDNFIEYKKKFGKDVGVSVIVYNFDKSIDQDSLVLEIKNISDTSDAIIVQLPLPEHLDAEEILNIIPPEKDVDVLSQKALENFATGVGKAIPPVSGALLEVLKDQNFHLEHKKIVLVGYGKLVGKPFGLWLSRYNIPFTVITKNTEEAKRDYILKNADVIISGAGIPSLIKPYMIKEGVVLLDGGTAEEGKRVVGDIDTSCYEKALFYTPVPGGIGPITIAVLYQNILHSVLSHK